MAASIRSAWRNPLAYPAGMPASLDVLHPAAANMRMAAVSSPGNMVSLLTGLNGAISSTPVWTVDGVIGPATTINGPGGMSVRFPGGSTTAETVITFGCIFNANSVAGSQQFFGNDFSLGSSISPGINAGPVMYLSMPGRVSPQFSSLIPTVNTPYFFAASGVIASSFSAVLLNLQTGKLLAQTVSSASTPQAKSGTTLCIGQDGNNHYANASIAAISWSLTLLSPTQLLQWAREPWGLWYPDAGDDWIAIAAAGGTFSPWWAANNNRPVLGTGTI